jgi:hypothetical protein
MFRAGPELQIHEAAAKNPNSCPKEGGKTMDKIELVESDELDSLYRPSFEGGDEGLSASRVMIRLEDDRTLDSGLVSDACRIKARGDEERLEQKFRWLTGYVLEEDQIDPLLKMLWRFDAVQDVRELTSLLR